MQSPPDRYQLVRRLRATPQVQSYEARHPRRPGRFLVEVLGPLKGDSPARVAFERDLALLSQLRHPFMLQTLELSQLPDGTLIVVSELPDGQTLQERLDAGVVAPLPSVLVLIDALAQALQAAQARGVTHGALDAGSVFLIPNLASGLGIPRLHGFGRHWLPDQPAGDPRQRDLTAFATLAGRLLNTALPGLDDLLARARDPGHAQAFESTQAFNEALQDQGRAWVAAPAGETVAGPRPPQRRRRSFLRMGLGASGMVTAAAAAVMIAGGLEPRLQQLSPSLGMPGRALATAAPEPATVVQPAPDLEPAAAVEPAVMYGPGAPEPVASVAPPLTRTARRSRPAPEPPLYQGRVWSARLGRLVAVDELGLPLDAEFPAGERAVALEPPPVMEPPPPPLPALAAPVSGRLP